MLRKITFFILSVVVASQVNIGCNAAQAPQDPFAKKRDQIFDMGNNSRCAQRKEVLFADALKFAVKLRKDPSLDAKYDALKDLNTTIEGLAQLSNKSRVYAESVSRDPRFNGLLSEVSGQGKAILCRFGFRAYWDSGDPKLDGQVEETVSKLEQLWLGKLKPQVSEHKDPSNQEST